MDDHNNNPLEHAQPEAPAEAPTETPIETPAEKPAPVENNGATPPAQPEAAPADAQPANKPMMDFQHVPKPGEPTPSTDKKKKSKIGLIFGIIVGILLIAGAIVAVIFLLGNGTSDEDIDIFESKAFFIEDNNSHFALFNDDGEQLSEFKYSYAGSFIAGTALVAIENEGGYGIIDENGKTTVEFGKYPYLSREGALYRATDSDYNESIITGKGKTVLKLDGGDVLEYDDDYLIATDKSGFKVFDYKGNTILTITENLDKELSVPGYSSEDGYFTVVHAGMNYILNGLSGKLITKFESQDVYQVEYVDKENNIIVLDVDDDDQIIMPVYEQGMKNSDEEVSKIKLLVDGKIVAKPDACESVIYTKGDGLLCLTDTGRYVLNTDLSVGPALFESSYIDAKTYAENVEDKKGNRGVDFYKNGAKVATVDCRKISSTGINDSNYYVVTTIYSSTCSKKGVKYGRDEYYTTDGKRMFDTDFSSANAFNKNGLAIVENDSGKHYLINDKNEKKSEEYDSLYERSTGDVVFYVSVEYLNKPENGYYSKGVILNSKGEKVTDFVDYPTSSYNYGDAAFLAINDGEQYVVYDLDEAKKLATSEEDPYFRDHYFTVSDKKTESYYTYNGKEIYKKDL